jgi:bifunctional N-acetylglutamate synthase/kinase
MASTKDVILRLLRSLGSRKEVEQYLKQYSAVDAQKFAIVKVGGNILAGDLDGLASSLSFLQNVGLYPVVLLGAGPQIDAALAEDGVPSQRLQGVRVTTPRVLEIARRVTLQENLRLVEALEELGTRARPVTAGVFEAELIEAERFGLVGRVVRVHEGPVQSSLRAGHVPILTSLGETQSGQIVALGSDGAVRELAVAMQPYKIIFLTETGGLLGEDGRVIYEGMRAKLQEIRLLLEGLPPESSTSITSPDRLAKELFTHTGSGTLVRRGERVQRFELLEGVDRVRLRALLEACFGRRLDEDYFDKKAFYRVYLSEAYTATAILTQAKGLPPYLDKFAVTTQAQGAGVGGSLWQRMKAENPKVFWRSRADNEINPWYFQQADGSHKAGRWTVFWYGLEGFDEIRACIDHALALPATLREHGTVEV